MLEKYKGFDIEDLEIALEHCEEEHNKGNYMSQEIEDLKEEIKEREKKNEERV